MFCNVVISVLYSFSIISLRKVELVAFLQYCSYCRITVNVLCLPRGAVGWSMICDCDIYSHTHLLFMQITNHLFDNIHLWTIGTIHSWPQRLDGSMSQCGARGQNPGHLRIFSYK